jgi:hypothetical protein
MESTCGRASVTLAGILAEDGSFIPGTSNTSTLVGHRFDIARNKGSK